MKFVQDHTVDSKAGFAARLPCDRFAALAVVGLDRLDDWCRPEAVAGMLVLDEAQKLVPEKSPLRAEIDKVRASL